MTGRLHAKPRIDQVRHLLERWGAGDTAPSALFFAYRSSALIIVGLVAGSVVAESAALPLLAAAAVSIGDGTREVELLAGTVSARWVLAGFVTLVVLRTVLRVLADILTARLGAELTRDVRQVMISRHIESGWERQTEVDSGTFIGVLVNNCNQILTLVAVYGNQSAALFAAAFMVAVAFVVSWPIALGGLVLALALAALVRPMARLARDRGAELADIRVAYLTAARHMMRLLRDTQGLGVGVPASGPTTLASEKLARSERRWLVVSQVQPALSQGAVLLVAAALLWAMSLTEGGTSARLAASVLLLVRALMAAQSFHAQRQNAEGVRPALARVGELYASLGASEPPMHIDEHWRLESVRLDEVSYQYPDGRLGLDRVSLGIERGEIVGVVGPSGAGKSTLIDVLLGFRRPTSGVAIAIGAGDGAPVALSDLVRQGIIGYVPQRPELLVGSLADNVRFYREAALVEVEEALELACLDPAELSDNGLEAVIGPEKDGVSGGQAQRIAVARAGIARPQFMVLDEPTSGLDEATEHRLVVALRQRRTHQTMVIVTHRSALLSLCDRVVTMERGGVAAVEVRSPDLDRQ